MLTVADQSWLSEALNGLAAIPMPVRRPFDLESFEAKWALVSGEMERAKAPFNREVILAGLQSLVSNDRLIALELVDRELRTFVDAEIGQAALSIVRQDPSPSVREAAVDVLGYVIRHLDPESFWDPENIDWDEEEIARLAFVKEADQVCREIFQDPTAEDSLRQKVLKAAVSRPQPWQEAAVRSAYYHGDETWKTAALACVLSLPGMDELILDALDNGSPKVRLEAAIIGGTMNLEQVVPVLQEAVVDEDLNPEVRVRAVRALGLTEAGDDDGVLRGLAENADTGIATEAGYALERFRTKDYW